MDDAEKWALARMVADRMLNTASAFDLSFEPRNLVLQITRNVILSGEPTEYFSQQMPVFIPETPEEDRLKPIDVLYGCYIHGKRAIEIYIKRIEQDVHLYSCDAAELTFIIRIHEYAHALHHLGVGWRDAGQAMTNYDVDGRTDWASFKNGRDVVYSSITTRCHELIAQAVTYASISQFPDSGVAGRLIEVFDSLEQRQPSQYRLNPELKQVCRYSNWPLVLDAARSQIPDHATNSFGLDEGLTAMIRKTAEQGASH